jgi:DNA-binding XRE family transcriptional regulator
MSARDMTSYDELAQLLDQLPFLVRETRRRRGLTQRAAADEIGCGFSTISRLEAGGADCSLTNAIALLRWIGRNGAPRIQEVAADGQ